MSNKPFLVPKAFQNQLSEFSPRGWLLITVEESGLFVLNQKMDHITEDAMINFISTYSSVMVEALDDQRRIDIQAKMGLTSSAEDGDEDDEDDFTG